MNLCFMRVFGGLKYVYKPVAIQEPNGFNLSFFFFSSAPSCHAVWTTENAKHKLINFFLKLKNQKEWNKQTKKPSNTKKIFFFFTKGPKTIPSFHSTVSYVNPETSFTGNKRRKHSSTRLFSTTKDFKTLPHRFLPRGYFITKRNIISVALIYKKPTTIFIIIVDCSVLMLVLGDYD